MHFPQGIDLNAATPLRPSPRHVGGDDHALRSVRVSKVMDHLPMKIFRRCVQRYQGNRHIQSFTCLDQFLCMAFAQLTFRGSGNTLS